MSGRVARVLLATGLALLAFAWAVEPDKAQYQYDHHNSGHSPWALDQAFDEENQSFRHWVYAFKQDRPNDHHVVVVGPDGTLYTLTHDRVYAFRPIETHDPNYGSLDQRRALLWEYSGINVGTNVGYGIAIRNGVLYVADKGNKRVLAFNAQSGQVVGELELDFKPDHLLPIPNGDMVVSGGARVCRLRLDPTMEKVWCTNPGGSVRHKRPAYDEDHRLLFGFSGSSRNQFYILNFDTGELLYRSYYPAYDFGVISQSPAYDPEEKQVIVGMVDKVDKVDKGVYYAAFVQLDFSSDPPGIAWQRKVRLVEAEGGWYSGHWGSPVISGQYVYIPTSYGGHFCRVDRTKWKAVCVEVDAYEFSAPVMDSSGRIVIPSHTHAVHFFLDPGTSLDRYYYNDFDDSPDFENEVAIDRCGNVYVTGMRYLHALGPGPCVTDVELEKAASSSVVNQGDTFTFTLTLKNRGRRPVFEVVVEDVLPTGLEFLSASASQGSYDPASGRWTVPELEKDESATLTLTVRAARAGTYTNTAEVVAQVGWDEDSEPGNHDPDEDDQASVTVEVRPPEPEGVSVSGKVYHDLEPNGQRDGGEPGIDPAAELDHGLYVKLFGDSDGDCANGFNASAEQVVPVDEDGNYRFSGVGPGFYCLVLSADDDCSCPNVYDPTGDGWLYTAPPGGVRGVRVGATDSAGNDFGLFHGGRVSGTVFRDTGNGDGVANDAVQNGEEPGIPRVPVTATDGSHTRRTTTDAEGRYTLYIPADWGTVTVSHPLRPASGYNDGSRVEQAANWAEASAGDAPAARANLGSASDLAGTEKTLNFGVVYPSALRPDQSGSTTTPGTRVYRHTYRPGTQGEVRLAQSGGRYVYQARVDANCDGDFDDPGESWQVVSSSAHPRFDVGDAWPRNPDGSFAACALEVRVLVPDGEPEGAVDLAEIEAALTWANNAGVADRRTVVDTTQVRILGTLRLEKRGRKVEDPQHDRAPIPFPDNYAVSVAGAPGDVLEYCIRYRNVGTEAVRDVVISDPVPFFAEALPNAYNDPGAIYWRGMDGTGHILTADTDADAGAIEAGVVRVQAESSLPPGKGGLVCYRVRIR